MANKLAKLEDLKTALKIEGSDIDADLITILEACASMTEQVAGVPFMGLRRQVDQTFYPCTESQHIEVIGLSGRPLESVSSVKLLYGPATPAEFDAETSLVQDTDFYIKSSELGLIGLFDEAWRTGERANQVVATTGFADPDDAIGGSAIEPPEDVQRGNIMQAVMLWNLRGTAGLKGVEAGGASGQLGHVETHPALATAANRYRRYFS
ncbi:MAG: hypothetical protein AAGI37_06905 [Planctomycetota bacterium]